MPNNRKLTAERPTRDELLNCLSAIVQDAESVAINSYATGDGSDWRREWQSEDPWWFNVIARARRLLEQAERTVKEPKKPKWLAQ